MRGVLIVSYWSTASNYCTRYDCIWNSCVKIQDMVYSLHVDRAKNDVRAVVCQTKTIAEDSLKLQHVLHLLLRGTSESEAKPSDPILIVAGSSTI